MASRPVKLKLLSRSVMKAKGVTVFPARVLGGAGITVTKENGTVTISASGPVGIGTTIQGWDGDLQALADNTNNGLWARTANGAGAARSIGAAVGLAVAHSDGIGGNPTISLDILSLTTNAAPDPAADYLITYDTSDGGPKKTLISDIPSAGGSSFGIADLSLYGTSANPQAAVTAAISAGYSRLFLPAGWTWIPTSNAVPADLEIIGENRQTSIISVAVPTADFLTVGARTQMHNVGLKSVFVTNSTTPLATVKVAPLSYYTNNSDSTHTFGNYPWTPFNIRVGSAITDTGHTSTDNQGLSVSNSSTGDGYFANTDGTGNSFLIWTTGSGDRGIWIENGANGATTTNHRGLVISDNTDGSAGNQYSAQFIRVGNPNSSIVVTDSGTGKTNPILFFSLAGQTSGNLIQIQHSVSTFSGDMISLTGQAGASGTFSGNFINCTKGTTKFKVDNAGIITGSTWQGVTVAEAFGGTGDTGTAWTSYTPTVTASTGTFTTVSATGAWKKIGKTTYVRFAITVTTVGTAATRVIVTLPVNAISLGGFGAGMDTSGGGNVAPAIVMAGYDSAGTASVVKYDNSFPTTSGHVLYGSLTYEAA